MTDDYDDPYDDDYIDDVDDPFDDEDDTPAPPRKRAPAKKQAKRAPAKRARPATRKQPSDRPAPKPTKAEAARRAEALGEDAEIEFRGVELTFPRDRADWPVRAIQAFTANRHIDGVESLLGAQQWSQIDRMNLTLREFGELADLIGAEMGVESGNG